MVTDDENTRDTRRLARDMIDPRDRDRAREEIEEVDGVEAAILNEMRDVKKALGEANGLTTRRQLETHMDSLATKLAQHRWRRDRDGNLPGDPYHRTQEEVLAESARLGAHH